MVSGPINSWKIEEGKLKAVTNFLFLGSKITVDSNCSHEIKKRLLLGRNVMTNQDNVKNQRYHFAYKSPYSQSYGFSSSHVWM